MLQRALDGFDDGNDLNGCERQMKKFIMTVLITGMSACLITACAGTAPASQDNTQPPSGALSGEIQNSGIPPTGAPTGGNPQGGASPGMRQGAMGPGAGSGGATETNGTAAKTFDSDTDRYGSEYTSAAADENAIRVENRAKVSLTDVTVNKTVDSSNTNNSDFYGMNAGVLVRDYGELTMKGGGITTNAAGGNGLFVYNTGSSSTISGTKISTSGNNSGGIEVAGGGEIDATDLTVTTQGNSAAAIRSDRGGGTMAIDKGSYTTNGTGSPAIYCTAGVAVSDATLTANNSEAVVIEGANSVTLNNCAATGNMKGTYGASGSENLHNVMIYQSMSGDASQGGGSFTMTGGSLTGKNGDMFYVTNTTATINISDVNLTNSDGNLLTVSGNDGSRGWGAAGSNGGVCVFTASGQQMNGDIVVDKISGLNIILNNSTIYTGSINPEGAAGKVNLTLSADSKWTLTRNAYLSSFSGNTYNITENGYHVYVNGKAID